MRAIASAPAKTILFGEHSVVYNQPAIAGAINKRAVIKIRPSKNNKTTFKSYDLKFEAELDTVNKNYSLIKGKPGIIRYMLEALTKFHDGSPIEILLSTNIPIGSGLGSSAAVTVATLAALFRYHGIKFNKKTLAHEAHMIEQAVQGIASPLDTMVSTYGGLVYLSKNKKMEPFKVNFNAPLVVGFTNVYGNTGKMVNDVKILKQKHPKIINDVIRSMGKLTVSGKQAIFDKDYKKIGELMNINQGFLDLLGVNTYELSRMIYTARECGAIGAKITGSGGGGSIIALCPGRVNRVAKGISRRDKIIKVRFTKKGVSSRIRK